jgi:molecular chaperone HscB
MSNFFDVFGVPVSFCIDESEITRIYLRKQRAVHPDAVGDELGDENASFLNVAYKTLMNPIARAEHLLEMKGVELDQTSSDFAAEMFAIREKYENLSVDAEKIEFENHLKNRMLEIIALLEQSEDDIGKFSSYLCLLRFIGSFLEKVGSDVYSWN